MRERVCKNCGGRQYKVVGQNMVKCQFCGTLYVDEQASKEEEILLVSANEKLRDAKFADAIVEFDKILSIYPNSFEAFFGKSLAKNKIVFYTNKKGSGKRPRYFGDKIPQLSNDDDFQSAINSAPEEIEKEYGDIAKRVERDIKKYCEIDKTKGCDVVIFQMSEENIDKTEKLVKKLSSKKIETYFLQELETKENEAETFYALSCAKVLLVVANKKNGYNDSDVKNLIDRFRYFISQRQKYSMGFVIAYDNNVIEKENLPQELGFCKNYVDFNSKNFVDYMTANIETVIEKTPQEVAKIETRKVEKVEPIKKEYVDVENITPAELGHYKVQNVEAKDAIKTKWIFLSLKNADFEATEKLIEAELEKDPNNAEMLFAQMLCEKRLRTAGEFFESISNFDNKEKIDNILAYSSKEFAEMFVDNWERLIESIDSDDCYNTYLLYLAKFDTPNRERFVECAQEVAVETMNEELIDNVLKCFKKDEVDKYVKFYFELAQKSDNQKYYDKILEIDQGHKQSNMSLLLRNFKTNQDKLEFRDREKIEDSLKFLDDEARSQFAFAVINLVIPVAFLDLKKAEEQIDFYLSYVDPKNYEIPYNIAKKLLDVNSFRLAEKYIAIAISRKKDDAKLYWELLKIKAHCKTDAEVVTSPVDLTQFPEWQTLLNYANDEQTEQYAEIVSKSHLYKGKKKQIAEELIDKQSMIEKLTNFLNRNNKILLENEEENGIVSVKGCEYFKVQLSPFEDYLNIVKDVETFDDYVAIASHIYQRLFFLGLTLESSVSSIQINEKGEGLKNVEIGRSLSLGHKKQKKIKTNKTKEERLVDPELIERRKKFWKLFFFGFFEIFPVLFLTILLTINIGNSKLVYAYFSQKAILIMMLYSVVVGFGNLIYYMLRKKKFAIKKKLSLIFLMIFAFLNVILLVIGFYLTDNTIRIYNGNEFETFVNNATYSNIEIENDIDFKGKEISVGDFYGKIDGKGFSLNNVALKQTENTAMIRSNFGTIKNLKINLETKTYRDISNFAVIAINNYGEIIGCEISGNVKIYAKDSLNCGGFTTYQCAGEITECADNTNIEIANLKKTAKLGKLAAVVSGKTSFVKNETYGSFKISENECEMVYFGGLAGYVDGDFECKFEQNAAKTDINVNVFSESLTIGGLFGYSTKSSKNNYADFNISIVNTNNGNVGGLYGEFVCYNPTDAIAFSYAKMNLNITLALTGDLGGIVGGTHGSIKNCFFKANELLDIASGQQIDMTTISNCMSNLEGYKKALGFSSEYWNGVNEDSSNYPTLK